MMQIRKWLRTYQGLLVSVAIIAGIALCLFFGLIPAVNRIFALRSESEVLSADVQALEEKIEILDAIDEPSYQRLLTELSLAVPPDKSLTSLFATIDGLSLVTGVSVLDVTLSRPGALATESARRQSAEEKKIGSNLLPFTVTVIGSYGQIHDFLERSISVRRFFRVRNFEIAFVDASAITVKMGMDAFFAPLPDTLGGIDQKISPLIEADDQVISKVASLPVLGSDVVDIQEGSAESFLPVGRDNPFEP